MCCIDFSMGWSSSVGGSVFICCGRNAGTYDIIHHNNNIYCTHVSIFTHDTTMLLVSVCVYVFVCMCLFVCVL